MLKLIRNRLLGIVEDIDCGNSNITEEEGIELMKYLQAVTDRTERVSKYEAYTYLGISRATFDNYVRAGLIPKGQKQAGFKELYWTKKDLDKFKNSKN